MLLALDIGNTNIILGVFDDGRLKATWRVATGVHRMPDEYASLMLNFFDRQGLAASQIRDAVLCCLLYTSPSPRDGLLSRMPSSA